MAAGARTGRGAAFDEERHQLVAFALDLTERKRAESEARESEARLREVQMALAHANRVATIGQLTASIAHEVNQPIATARNNAASALRFLSRHPPDLAVEAMSSVDDAPRELSISTEPRGADEILVAVRDSGPGTAPEHLERVFDSFYTTKPSGMGLGLSICRSIVDAHGGRLWVDANEPQRAVFQFTLPAGNKNS